MSTTTTCGRGETRLAVLAGALLGMLLCPLAPAATYPVPYTLSESAKVSINIYDSQGHIVRELLHAAPRSAGAQAEIWDGLDSDNLSLPAGAYTWKLLSSQGLQAKYLQNPGSSYPPGVAPGCHGGPAAVAVGDDGMYVGAGSAESADMLLVKQTLDGKVLWHAPHVVVYEGAVAIAVSGGAVRMLTGKGNVWNFSTADGAYWGSYGVAWSGDTSFPYDMDLDGTTMVVSYSNHDAIRWIDPANGAVLDTATVAAPQGVTVAADGTVYVTTGNKIVKLTSADHTLVDVAVGLTSPTYLDLDHATGNLLVVETGASQQVKQITPGGALLKTYGQVWGRGSGLYTPAMQQSFQSVADVAADGNGGFLVVERNAPRRTASLRLSDGTLIREWYGGQVWSPWISPEPDNPNVGWMVSSWDSMMRMTLNPSNNTWQVHSTYIFSGLANGLISGHDNAEIWEVRKHAGTTYLCRVGDPCVVKVDETNWRLLPVTVGATHVQHYWSTQPQIIKDWAGSNDSFLWVDQNGNGLPQQSEMTFYAAAGDWGGGSVYVDDKLNHYFYVTGAAWTTPTNNALKVHDVTGWNSVGAPLYGHFPTGQVFSAKIPARVQGIGVWGAFFYGDQNSGNVYGAFNCNMPYWGVSPDSFLTKFDRAGTACWTVGRKGTGPGKVVNAFRRFVGQAHGCLVLMDFNGGWHGLAEPCYVWDSDGLWVGGLFDNPDLVGIPATYYGLSGDNLAGTLYTHPATGETLFFGSWENEARVYRITGWDAFTRQNGKLTVALPTMPQPTFTAEPGLYNQAQAVTICSATAGATIRYTLNGSTPSPRQGTIYSAPVNIHTNTTLIAIAYKPGMADSEVTSGAYVIDYNLWVSGKDSRGDWITAPPSPCEGLTMRTSSAAPWTPTRDRLHDGAISAGSDLAFQWNDINADPAKPHNWLQIDLGSVQLVHALRIWNGGRDYDLGAMGNMEVYVDNTPQADDTAFVGHGSVLLATVLPQPTQIKTAVDSGVITLPTPTLGRYVTLRFTTFTSQIHAISEVGVCITQGVEPPTCAPAPGVYTNTQSVTLSTATAGTTIRYTTDGSTPSESHGTVFSAPVVISATTTLRAIASKNERPNSVEINSFYTISSNVVEKAWEFATTTEGWGVAAMVSGFSWKAGGYVGGTITGGDPSITSADNLAVNITTAKILSVRLKNATLGTAAKVYFITTGDTNWNEAKAKATAITPNSDFTEYILDMSSVSGWTGTLRCLRIDPIDVIASSGSFRIDYVRISEVALMCAAPTFSVAPGGYVNAQSVALSSATAGATIRYTLDGSTPSPSHGAVYSNPISIGITATLKAIAYKSGIPDSAITVGAYTINRPLANSASDFSGIQGEKNWTYGYYDKPASSLFVPGSWNGSQWSGVEQFCLN